MMKLRLFLKNSAKFGLNSLCVITASVYFLGCSSSTSPTYTKDNIAKAIRDICRKEYKLNVRVKLAGSTLWVYLPLKDLLVKTDKPEKYSEYFEIGQNKTSFNNGILKVDYLVKAIPEQEKTQEYKYDKKGTEKIGNVWKALRRVVFSMDRSKAEEPKFYCLVTADIRNGFETREFFYYLDLKKVSYDFISWTEYQHRTVQETGVAPEIIGDMAGRHLDFRDMTMEDFIAAQIEHRIKMKFQKPEVSKKTDVDREILKVVTHVIKIYGIEDIREADLFNQATQNRTILNKPALLSKPTD